MSGSAGVMDQTSPLRLELMLLIVFLPSNIVYLHGHSLTGVEHKLHCVNDFLATVNCSLNIAPSEDTSDSNSYWLNFSDPDREFVCMLTNTYGDYYLCSVTTTDEGFETFLDTDFFDMSLCHNQSDGSKFCCEPLDEPYEPVENIKPNAPCCLTVNQTSSQHHFTWISTYEKYSDVTDLTVNLKYQLRYYKRQDKDNVASRDINTNNMNFAVDDDQFVPGTDYAAIVRSSPNGAFFMGEWSAWSAEVHWTTNAMSDPTFAFVSGLGLKGLIASIVTVPLIILLCYAPFKKWRQSAFIPTPAPYFQTLYSDCQGDFKSWVVTQENAADMLKAEETIQIDTLTECADVQEKDCPPHFHQQFIEGSTYSNVTNSGCDPSLLGIPYAVSTMAPLSASGSLKSLTLGSLAEGDSGCWLSSDMSLEKDTPWYCNEYCTLNSFQQSSPVTAEHHKSPSRKTCPIEIIRVDAIGEA